VGKSTLLAALAASWRRAGQSVGILAVDPTSPFSGGALLGDRIRMGALGQDPDVFIRSLASRGAMGGLSAAVHDAADVLEAAGFDPVLVETVGVGQAEVEIAGAADTTVLVLAPGGGDEIQAMKAGLLEAADLIVVNQADRRDAAQMVEGLRAGLALGDRTAPPILCTIATRGEGVEELREALDARTGSGHRVALLSRRLDRARRRLRGAVDAARARTFWAGREAALEEEAARVARGGCLVGEAAARLIGSAGGREASDDGEDPEEREREGEEVR
ncbi:MAG: ArgK/MeaB family GTPase, partial [Planctomycetota bacterium]